MRVYYAHSVAIFGTDQEVGDIAMLERMGFEVCNPNVDEHVEGYKAGGMDYYESVVKDCDMLAFRAHPDGNIPAGVAKEINWMRQAGGPIIELPQRVTERMLSVADTKAYLRSVGAR